MLALDQRLVEGIPQSFGLRDDSFISLGKVQTEIPT